MILMLTLQFYFDEGFAGTFPATVEDYYRAFYFEALDLTTSCIEDRFNQHGYITQLGQAL